MRMVLMIHLTGLYQLILNNYNGSTLAADMMEKMNDGLYDDMKGTCKFNIEYTYVETQLNIERIDLIFIVDQYYGHVDEVYIVPDEDLLADKWGWIRLNKKEMNSMTQIVRLTKTTLINKYSFGRIHVLYKFRLAYN